ncbi:TIGR03862 family flavoprotein [Marivivens donghaensis]|uniref:TIGR03862 family flavoprotein n=1 Tax=Marivivens donghaensis TaxID=1699413 RepID=UPI00201F4099|nr:TIGR03862 family flavoprotein [Marivivens donghaensis]MCL7409470.1 TIGR03862 family flavoprotein [Marivivens donghaensis]MDN3702949.1 TIGR03862 family flavoprotein [Marivivens donghaensis]
MAKALVIGAGPAGLMAADVLSADGHSVLIADAMPSPARKFLMAGKSGLNLTKVGAGFLEAYGDIPASMVAALSAFGPDQVIEWANGLGQEVFIGSTGRVFPVVMKASPLLRAWLKRLDAQQVKLQTRWRWTGWDGDDWLFETPDGSQSVSADIVILALGGASWARLGSDGLWAEQFPDNIAPFKPANMGFIVSWSDHMTAHFGAPVKGCTLIAGDHRTSGEFVISSRGIEGGGIYTISAAVRDGAPLIIDLLPSLTVEDIRQKLSRKGKESLSNVLRKTFRLDPVKIALLNEFGRPFPDDLATLIKNLPIRHDGPRPMDEAISVAGGLRFDALDNGLMMRDRAGVFCVGEMLDWEAPTGGYLITGCLATGRHAALAAIDYAAQLDVGGH